MKYFEKFQLKKLKYVFKRYALSRSGASYRLAAMRKSGAWRQNDHEEWEGSTDEMTHSKICSNLLDSHFNF